MIIPKEEKTIIKVIYCPICDKYYSINTSAIQWGCTVLHAPGDCCHMGDKSISKNVVDVLLKLGGNDTGEI